jgi:hypothetical protein
MMGEACLGVGCNVRRNLIERILRQVSSLSSKNFPFELYHDSPLMQTMYL